VLTVAQHPTSCWSN